MNRIHYHKAADATEWRRVSHPTDMWWHGCSIAMRELDQKAPRLRHRETYPMPPWLSARRRIMHCKVFGRRRKKASFCQGISWPRLANRERRPTNYIIRFWGMAESRYLFLLNRCVFEHAAMSPIQSIDEKHRCGHDHRLAQPGSDEAEVARL